MEQTITQHDETLQEWCRIISGSYGYYTVENPDEEEAFENLCIELCVERFMVEGIDLTGWHIKEHPYGDKNVEEYSFVNEEQELFVDFEIQKDGVYDGKGYIAIPMYNQPTPGPIQLVPMNTVRSAIQHFSDCEDW